MRVLLADHDATMLEATVRTLGEGFRFDVTTSKAGCVDLLRRGEVDLLIACEQLSDGSGLELLSHTGSRWPKVLRVFASSPDRLRLLAGRLGPFKLFRTLAYPLEAERLRAVLVLAQAPALTRAQTSIAQQSLANEEDAEEEPAIAAALGNVRRTLATAAPRRGAATAAMRASHAKSSALPLARAVARARDNPDSEPAADAAAVLATLGGVPQMQTQARSTAPARGRVPWLAAIALGVVALAVAIVVKIGSNNDSRVRQAATVVSTTTKQGVPALPDTTPKPAPPAPVAKLVADIESALDYDEYDRAALELAALRELAPTYERLSFLETLAHRGQARRARQRRSDRDAEPLAAAAASPTAAAAHAAASTPEQGSSAIPASRPPATTFSGRTLEDDSVNAAGAPIAAPPATGSGAAPELTTSAGASTGSAELPATAAATPVGAVPAPTTPAAPAIRAARLIRQIQPTFPDAAARSGVEGFVDLGFTVTARGAVRDVRVLAHSPRDMFDGAAVEAVRQWQYEPRYQDNVAVDWPTQIHLEFKLAK